MSIDEYYQHPSEINLAKAWELLDLAQERAQKELEQAQRDLATCAEIRKRLEKVREFPATPTRRPGPFAELLKLIQ